MNVFRLHYKRSRRGRPQKLVENHQVLGMILQFYTALVEDKNLCQIFGIPPSTLSRTRKKAESALRDTLAQVPDAEIKWPTLEEQLDMGAKVQAKYPLISGRWGFADGKNLNVMEPTRADLQNAMFNGWLHCVFVTGVLLVCVDGTLAWGKHNVVGSWNDGEISRHLQKKLMRDNINLPGHGIVTDTAFPVAGDLFGRIISPLKVVSSRDIQLTRGSTSRG